MKILRLFHSLLLMNIFTILYAFPTVASPAIVGSLDIFDSKQITGWAYENGNPLSPAEVQLKITNLLTGETVREVTAYTSYQRNDLIPLIGPNGAPGFTASVDLDFLSDGTYTAAAYKDGQKFSNTIYYTKGDAAGGQPLKALGTFKLTGYCPCRSCSGKWGRRTSSGAAAATNHTVAVDPKVIPIGSKLLINGAVYTAEDIGSGVKKNHIDIFFESHSQARQFGVRYAEIYLVENNI